MIRLKDLLYFVGLRRRRNLPRGLLCYSEISVQTHLPTCFIFNYRYSLFQFQIILFDRTSVTVTFAGTPEANGEYVEVESSGSLEVGWIAKEVMND